jgi:hypothetical protein
MRKLICLFLVYSSIVISAMSQEKQPAPYPLLDSKLPVSKEVIRTTKEFRDRFVNRQHKVDKI